MAGKIPQSGAGKIDIGPPPRPRGVRELPHSLVTTDQRDTQYHLARWFSRRGDVALEAACGDAGRIDIVWTQNQFGIDRTVGVEIKTEHNSETLIGVSKQVERYGESTVADVVDVDWVSHRDELWSAADVSLFDELWLLWVGADCPFGSDEHPGDGLLVYDQNSGSLTYEISEEAREATLTPPHERKEQWYAAQVWAHYTNRDYCLSAEVTVSQPSDRWIGDGELRFNKAEGTTREVDIVVGDLDTCDPVDGSSQLHAIEVKQSLNNPSRVREQLSMYCESGMFSEVSLAVPADKLKRASNILGPEHDRVGLLSVSDDGTVRSIRQVDTRLQLNQVPVIDKTTETTSLITPERSQS